MAKAAAPTAGGGGALAEIDRYWFGWGSPTSLGVFRILIGFLNLANLLLIFPYADSWFSERGFTPLNVTMQANPPLDRGYRLFGHWFTLPFTVPRLDLVAGVVDFRLMQAFYLLVVLAAILATLGLWSRASTIALAVGVVSLQHRNVLILHGGDSALRLGALYMALAPSGAACSLDRFIALWKGRLSGPPRAVSLWPQRMLQFNLALIYFTTWWVKMDGDKWRDGTAAWYPIRLQEFHRFWVPGFLKSAAMTPFLTYSTIAIELSLGTLVFWRPARKWVLLGGLAMHGFIEYSMNIPLFSFSMCSYYVVFYEGAEVTAWFARLGRRLARLRVVLRAPGPLREGPAEALRSLDPLGLVEYRDGDQASWSAETLDGEPVNHPRTAAWLRSIGAWPFGAVPGLWGRLLKLAAGRGRFKPERRTG